MQVTVARKLAGLAARGSLPIPSLPGLSGIDRVNNWIAAHESKAGTNGTCVPQSCCTRLRLHCDHL